VVPITLRALADKFEKYTDATKVPRYAKLVRKYLENRILPFFGKDTLTTSVTAHKIEQYMIARKSDKHQFADRFIKDATINRQLAAVKHLFRKAEEWGHVAKSPARNVKPLKNDSTARTRYLSPDEVSQLIRTAEENRRTRPPRIDHFAALPEFIEIAVNTGVRLSEELFLEFEDVDRNARVLHIRQKPQLGFKPKSHQERTIPLNDPAMAAFDSLYSRKHPASDFVFHRIDGTPWKSIKDAVASLVEDCSLKGRVTIHTLRHTFGSQLAMAGQPMQKISKLMGHHSVTVTEKHYIHLSPDNLNAAVNALANVWTEANGKRRRRALPKSIPNPWAGKSRAPGEIPVLTPSRARPIGPKAAGPVDVKQSVFSRTLRRSQ